jgi:hypothetical protein
MSAEMYSNWTLFIAPIILHGRCCTTGTSWGLSNYSSFVLPLKLTKICYIKSRRVLSLGYGIMNGKNNYNSPLIHS